MLEENVREVERTAAAQDADLLRARCPDVAPDGVGGVHRPAARRRGGRPFQCPSAARDLSDRVERALRSRLPDGHRRPPADDDLMIAVAMVSGAVIGPTREQRERRARAAWRLARRRGGTGAPVRGGAQRRPQPPLDGGRPCPVRRSCSSAPPPGPLTVM